MSVPLGQGHRLKLLHNYVSIGFMALLAEAAAQSADAGVDPAVLVEVLANGGGAGAALDRLPPTSSTEIASGLPFSSRTRPKDIDYYREMAQAAGAQQSIADGVSEAIRELSMTPDAKPTCPRWSAYSAGQGDDLSRESRRKRGCHLKFAGCSNI